MRHVVSQTSLPVSAVILKEIHLFKTLLLFKKWLRNDMVWIEKWGFRASEKSILKALKTSHLGRNLKEQWVEAYCLCNEIQKARILPLNHAFLCSESPNEQIKRLLPASLVAESPVTVLHLQQAGRHPYLVSFCSTLLASFRSLHKLCAQILLFSYMAVFFTAFYHSHTVSWSFVRMSFTRKGI